MPPTALRAPSYQATAFDLVSETVVMNSFGSQNQRRRSPGGNTSWDGGHDIGEHQSTERDEDYGDNGHSRGGDRIDLMGKQVPKRPTEGNADWYTHDRSDSHGRVRLPGNYGT